ncbi:hypothetical protein BJX66DRAFT_28068 [Aspergillus keveii]|uniref:Uncharacterized protein n=1 Tax=Aspergillus keveii TaxID=714993 RepID=A0ABR4FUF7_9EURO
MLTVDPFNDRYLTLGQRCCFVCLACAFRVGAMDICIVGLGVLIGSSSELLGLKF